MPARTSMKRTILLGLVLQGFLAGAAPAQGPPINTETAFVVGLQGAAVRTFVQTMRKAKLLREGAEVADPLKREVRVVAVPLMLPYEVIPNRLVAGIGIPYLDKELRLTQDGGRRKLAAEGWGDLSLFAKYQLYQRDVPRKTTRITFKGVLKLPTGGHEEKDAEGNLLPRGIQPGTGSADWAAGPIFTHSAGRLGINADALYWFNGESAGYEFGNALDYDLALGYRVYPQVYRTYPSPYATVYLELNGHSAARDRADGQQMGDSGGHTLFLSPGVQYVPFATFILEASVQIPVVQELNGTQLGTDFVLRTGIRWLML